MTDQTYHPIQKMSPASILMKRRRMEVMMSKGIILRNKRLYNMLGLRLERDFVTIFAVGLNSGFLI